MSPVPIRTPHLSIGGFSTLLVVTAGILLAAGGPVSAGEVVVDDERILALERQVAELQAGMARDEAATVKLLERQIEALTREIEELKLGSAVAVKADTGLVGFSPAASKIYKAPQGVSLGGYGEMLYENYSATKENDEDSGKKDRVDALRSILYVGYKFNDDLLFNSEIEFEHATTGIAGSASVEFAYVDYRASEELGVRGGLLLLPIGLTNELHEPTTFLGTTRPLAEQKIIPSTWREAGAGVYGEAANLSYRAYVVNSLDAGGFDGGGLRSGRQKGSKATAEDLSLAARVDYVGTLGLIAGASLYAGESAQNVKNGDGVEIGGMTTIFEAHADLRRRGFELRALYALASVGEVSDLNAVNELEGSASIGEKLTGGYAQLGYDVLRSVETDQQLLPYVRYEMLNTQDQVPEGFSSDPSKERTALLLGAMWRPVTQVAVKADYQIHRNEDETGIDQFNVALGYLF